MSTHKIGLLILATLLLAFTAYFYGDILFNPNGVLINATGDGLKNYYASIYHSLHDESYHHFSGMNYPFGELAVYTDAQLSISNLIKLLHLGNFSVAIINLLIVLSTFFCGVTLYFVFRELKMRPLFAVIGAFSLAILQPQLFRSTAHFSLSYAFFIPFGIWLFLKFTKTRRQVWIYLVVVYHIFLFFVHPYLGLISTLLFISCLWVFWLLSINRFGNLLLTLKNSFIIFLPVAFFKGYLFVIDHHVDRGTAPWGIDLFQANFQTVFTPVMGPIHHFLNQFVAYSGAWEGYAYIGLATILSVLLVLFLFAAKSFRNIFLTDPNFKFLITLCISGSILLWWSFGYFVSFQDGLILDWLPVLHQFRSLGRFAWPFYYCMGITGFYFMLKAAKTVNTRLILALLFGAISLSEAIPHHYLFSSDLHLTENRITDRSPSNLTELSDYLTAEKVQCILPLPFYYIGTDAYLMEGSAKSHFLSFAMSAKTGAPIMGGMSSRTSISEVEKVIEFLGPFQYPKQLLTALNKKPIAITYTGETLTYAEQNILNHAKLIGKNQSGALYLISPSDMANASASPPTIPDSISEKVYSSNDSLFYFLDDFDSAIIHHNFLGPGSTTLPQNVYEKLTTFEYGQLIPNTTYEVSVWMNLNSGVGKDQMVGALALSNSNKNLGWINASNTRESLTILENWMLVRFEFTMPNEHIKVEILSHNIESGTREFDNLLVRELNQDVYQRTTFMGDSVVIKNNEVLF